MTGCKSDDRVPTNVTLKHFIFINHILLYYILAETAK